MISKGTKVLRYPFGDLLIEEFDGHSTWPGGDPVPESDETLVIHIARRPNPNYDPAA